MTSSSMRDGHRRAGPIRTDLFLMALLPGVLLSAFYEYKAFSAAGALGFPLDDAWIHAQFARNLATGQGFSYTGTRWVAGSTAPLWTVVLAIGYFVLRNAVLAAAVWGTLLQAATAYYAARLVELLGAPRMLCYVCATASATVPVIVWGAVSGMEVPLASALLLAGLFYYLQDDGPGRHRGTALVGLAALARPETLVMVASMPVIELFRRGSAMERAKGATASALLGAAMVAPAVLLSYATIGRPLPTTFYVKSGPGVVRAANTQDAALAKRNLGTFGPLALKNFAIILREQLSVAALFVPLGLVACFRRRPVAGSLFLLALTVVPFAMGSVAPQRLKPDNVRYVGQLVAVAVPVSILGVAWLVRRRTAFATSVSFGLVCFIAVRTVEGAGAYATSVKNIEELHVTAGRWLREHLPGKSLIAVNDVGAIAYFSGHRVLDLEGLVSPEALEYRGLSDRGLRLAMAARPAYVVIFPFWYPDIAARSDLFAEIHRFTISDNRISAGNEMVVYRTPWTALSSVP